MSESDIETPVRIDIPLDHHPLAIKGDTPGAVNGRAALKTIYDAYGRINDTAEVVNDKGKLAQAAQPFAERAIAQAGRTAEGLASQISQLDTQMQQKLTHQPNSQQALEVRAYWARQDDVFGPASVKVRAGDLVTISALLNAPAYLSGLTDEQQVILRNQALNTVAPELVQRRTEATRSLELVEVALNHFTKITSAKIVEWRDEDSKLLAERLK